jgi:hypothetical protein
MDVAVRTDEVCSQETLSTITIIIKRQHTSFDDQVNELHNEFAKAAERFSISSASEKGLSQALNPISSSKLDPSSPAFDARV